MPDLVQAEVEADAATRQDGQKKLPLDENGQIIEVARPGIPITPPAGASRPASFAKYAAPSFSVKPQSPLAGDKSLERRTPWAGLPSQAVSLSRASLPAAGYLSQEAFSLRNLYCASPSSHGWTQDIMTCMQSAAASALTRHACRFLY